MIVYVFIITMFPFLSQDEEDEIKLEINVLKKVSVCELAILILDCAAAGVI